MIGMKLGRNVEARVFCREGEDEGKIAGCLLSLFPFSLENEKIPLAGTTATGFNERKIRILRVRLEKDRHINAFIRKFFARLSAEQKSLLGRQLDSRIDDGMNFFVRLDKEKLLNGNVFWITDSGDCFHIRIGVAAFPAKKETAKKVVEGFLKMEG
jgi:RNA binding exosome subunit